MGQFKAEVTVKYIDTTIKVFFFFKIKPKTTFFLRKKPSFSTKSA